MTKRILSLVAAAVCFLSVKSQVDGFHIGGRLGLGESNIQGAGLPAAQPKLAISTGLATNYQFNKWFGLNADLLVSSVGCKTRGITTQRDFLGNDVAYTYTDRYDLIYAEVPLTGQVSFWMKNFFIRAYTGPGINFRFFATQSRVYDDENFNSGNGYLSRTIDQTNNVTYSMIYGAGIGVRGKKDRLYFLDL
ncbi:MAG TPA: outer membrane beta-barrel protein, partial [Bacteroidia bacterium]|nr:outer membrane beta-barrel protein [Bacteroidia bacterium]